MDLLKNKTVAIGVVVAILLIAGYLLFMRGGEEQNPLTVSAPTGESQTIGRELLVTLRELRSLTLDGNFFTDPIFQSLRDFSVPLPVQTVGRRNPFAPLGVVQQPIGTTTPRR